jgi:phosphatidylserine/phosphatidylglycerophosphate/cardiolipin synthase-like enzyme
MGWSDVALCLSGPVVQDLRTHFTQRWNFIYDEKYSHKSSRYTRLPDTSSGAQQGGNYPPPPMQQRGFEGEEEGQRGFGREEEGERGLFGHGAGGHLRQKVQSKFDQYSQEHGSQYGQQQSHAEHSSQRGGVDCQIARSSAKWSHNLVTTEVGDILIDKMPADKFISILFKTPTVRLSETANTSSTSRTSSSSPPLATNRSRLRTRSVRPWLNVSSVLHEMARSTR